MIGDFSHNIVHTRKHIHVSLRSRPRCSSLLRSGRQAGLRALWLSIYTPTSDFLALRHPRRSSFASCSPGGSLRVLQYFSVFFSFLYTRSSSGVPYNNAVSEIHSGNHAIGSQAPEALETLRWIASHAFQRQSTVVPFDQTTVDICRTPILLQALRQRTMVRGVF